MPAILLPAALALALGHSHDGWAAPQAEQPTLSIEERATEPPQLFPPTYDEAVTALIRAFDVGTILAAGLDQAFARLPAKIGPIPKERYTQCARAKLSSEVVEAAVRPALVPEIQDAGLAMRLARLLGSPVGRKTKEAALSGKTMAEAGITGADLLEFNRFMENPALKAFLEQGGLRRVKDALTRAIRVESNSASDACVRELMPLYRLTHERSA
ncbi:hypothetical protein [Cupriavidus sp. YAF13]|uniref:hypothetical protein n=1 Tax=Cupriavidus sp. YAF13 TaxID=3233075 RepID=UPI003F92C559